MTPEQQQTADALRAPALVEAPESIHRHDPDVTHAFAKIFSHPDNAEVARAFTVGLAVNDPALPVAEVVEEPATDKRGTASYHGTRFSSEEGHEDGFTVEGIRFRDTDGDEIRVAYVTANDGDTAHSRVTFTIANKVVALTLAAADEMTDFLDAALDDGTDEVSA